MLTGQLWNIAVIPLASTLYSSLPIIPWRLFHVWRVIDYAKEKGLRRVYGDVLAENTTMLQMCAELGFHAEDVGSDIRRVVLDLENVGAQ